MRILVVHPQEEGARVGGAVLEPGERGVGRSRRTAFQPRARELAEQMLRVLDLAAREADETNGFVAVNGSAPFGRP